MKKNGNTKQEMKIFYDLADNLLLSKRTIEDIFNYSIDLWKDNTVFIYEENDKTKQYSFNDVRTNSYLYGSVFKKELKDIKRGDYIALKANNSPRWIFSFFGLLSAGYKVIIVNPILNNEDTVRILKEVNAKAIVGDKDASIPGYQYINISNLDLINDSFEPRWENEIAFSTSGTTGDSRVFAYTGEDLIHQINATRSIPDTSVDMMYDKRFGHLRHLVILPFSHIFGFVAVFLFFFFFGSTLVFPPNLSAKTIVEFSKKYKITHIFAVPLLWDTVSKTFLDTLSTESKGKQELVNKAIKYSNNEISATEAGIATTEFIRNIIKKKILGKYIRFCIAGGSALSKETLKTINGLDYPLYNGYGMTEIGITSVELSPNVDQRNKDSVGKPLYNVEYKIKDGELLVKAPQIHSFRYIDGKKLPADLDEEGYFHTGDIAIKDGNGYYFIKGRTKDVIILANGENIYPEELEIKFKNIPYVSNLSIVEHEKVLSLILELEGTVSIAQIKEIEEAIAKDNDSLPNEMQARKIFLAKEKFPINASLKIKRHELIDSLKKNPENFIEVDRSSTISLDGLDEKVINEYLTKIIPIFAQETGHKKEEISNTSHIILDLGGDSFSYMSLVGSIENEFGITIENEKLGKLNTPVEFAVYIYNKKN